MKYIGRNITIGNNLEDYKNDLKRDTDNVRDIKG